LRYVLVDLFKKENCNETVECTQSGGWCSRFDGDVFGYAQSSEPEAGTSGQAASMPMASPTHAMPSKAADRALAKRVRRTLAHTKGLNMSGLVVLVKHGRVALTGTVPSSDQIGKAAQVAGSVPGVTGVRNDLTVAVKGH
jgi:hyperosmotically inducible protein